MLLELKMVYETQHKFSNGAIVDALLFAPAPLGTIAIDSKFPLENYQRMTDKSKDKNYRDQAEKLFINDVKKHINDISEKYIIPGETSDEAIMFLPAEAIFAEINAYHAELINYAYSKKSLDSWTYNIDFYFINNKYDFKKYGKR